jgi:hypothetical protein
LSQYPHILTLYLAPESSKDNSGDWVTTQSEPVIMDCREEPNSGGRMVVLEGGKQHVYSSKIYMRTPLDEGLKVGANIEVSDAYGVRISGEILNIRINPKKVQIWV